MFPSSSLAVHQEGLQYVSRPGKEHPFFVGIIVRPRELNSVTADSPPPVTEADGDEGAEDDDADEGGDGRRRRC